MWIEFDIDELRRLYREADETLHPSVHTAGLLAVAAEAERRGREAEAAMTLRMGPVVAAARHLLRAAPGDAKARDALRAAVDAYTDAALVVNDTKVSP